MKKLCVLMSVLAITGCVSYRDNVSYTTNQPSLKIEPVIIPTVTIGNKVIGKAECANLLYIFQDIPSERTYGATINAQSDVSSNSECAAAAVYDALTHTDNADVLIAPKFTSITHGFLCLPWVGCFIETQNMFVEAHAGRVTYTHN